MVTATNGTYSGSGTFTWNVAPAITIIDPGTQTNADGQYVYLPIEATDVRGGLNYAAADLPNGLSIDPNSGIISGIIAFASSGSPYTVTVTATDGTYTGTDMFTWKVAPAITITDPGNLANFEGDNIYVPITIADANGDGAGVSVSATGLPNGLTIDPVSGVISGAIAPGASGISPYTVMLTATDGTYSAMDTFTWNVYAGFQINVLSGNGEQALINGPYAQPLEVQVTDLAGNPIDGVPVTFTVPGSGPSATFQDSGSTITLVTGPDGMGNDGTVSTPLLTANGIAGSFSITVVPAGVQQHSLDIEFTNALIEIPGDQLNVEGDNVNLPIPAANSDGLPLQFSAMGLPIGLSIDPQSGVISGQISVPGVGYYQTTVTTSDSSGVVALSPPGADLQLRGEPVRGLAAEGLGGSAGAPHLRRAARRAGAPDFSL